MGRRSRISFLFLLPVLLNLGIVSGLLLDLFGEKDRHGISIRVEVSDSECSNLPVSWSSKAASVNTLGSCVQLYDEPLCKGALTIIQPFHTIHQMDLSLINFNQRVQSASACGPKIKTGRFVIQNAADASVLTVASKFGGFARAFTTNASTLITKAQQWEVIELQNSEYSLKPREFEDNYPVTYDEASLKKQQIKKKIWKLMSVGRGRYLIKSEKSQTCLYKTDDNKVQEHDCRIWSPNQEWVLKEIFGNLKEKKKSNAIGPGLNFNVLSKVASYVPSTQPPPQFAPIFYNASQLAQLKRRTTLAPYVIRKKIRRGPRPQTKPLPLLSDIRPPGLKPRPALPDKIGNNNNFLLEKRPLVEPQGLKDFEPSEDRVETFAYYQTLLLAKRKREQEIRIILEALRKSPAGTNVLGGPPPPLPPQDNKDTKKKKTEEEEEEDESRSKEESEEEEEDQDQPDKEKKKRKKPKKKEDETAEEDEIETESSEEGESEKKRKRKRKHRKPHPPPAPTHPPFNPYDINFHEFNHLNQSHVNVLQDEVGSPGFFGGVFEKVKSLVPGVPFLSSKDSSSPKLKPNLDLAKDPRPDSHPVPKKSGKKKYPHLLRPGEGFGLRKSRNPTTTTPVPTTTEKSSLFGFLG